MGTEKIPGKLSKPHNKVLIVGDLAVDFIFNVEHIKGNINLVRSDPIVGGCAFNAAMGFKQCGGGVIPIVCASVGDDLHGRIIQKKISEAGIIFAGNASKTAITGFTSIIYSEDNNRIIINDSKNSANNYDINTIKKTIDTYQIGRGDIILFVGYAIPRFGIKHCMQLVEIFIKSGAAIAVDLVPHNLFAIEDAANCQKITLADCYELLKHAILLIAEYRTLCGFLGRTPLYGVDGQTEPSTDEIKYICDLFPGVYIDLRYGIGEISMQLIYKKNRGLVKSQKTGYELLEKENRRGFGDILTARTIIEIQTGMVYN